MKQDYYWLMFRNRKPNASTSDGRLVLDQDRYR
jgi:hypothetical protein